MSKAVIFQTIQFTIKTVLFQTIQFWISIQFNSIWPIDMTIRCFHSGREWTWDRWQWRGTPHSPKLQHYCSLTIRLLNIISRTLVEGPLTPLPRFNRCFLKAQPIGQYNSSKDTTTVWKKFSFILSQRSDLHMIDNMSIWFLAFAERMSTSFSVNEILLPRYKN